MKLCAEAGCQARVTRDRCPEHAAQQTQLHRSQHNGFYASKRWRITRRRKLSLNPICERCDEELAVEVHHVHGVSNGNPYALDGLEALCKPCHSKTTRREQLEGERRVEVA
jgi:5-methylcytosine-specific restriction enzyme A